MRHALLWLAFFLALAALPASARASEFDPCPRMLAADAADAGGMQLLWDWFSKDSPDQSIAAFSDHAFYVTVKPGRFVNVSCDDAQFEEQEMYPIGIVVKPIAYVHLSQFEAGRGDRAILVITEYGHRKLIREHDIQPIIDNLTYIFSDTPTNSRICRDASDCPGNDASVCERPAQCRYEISSRHGYAVAVSSDDLAQSTIAAYSLIRSSSESDPELWADDAAIERIEQANEKVCTPIPVQAMRVGGTAHQPRPSYLSLCALRKDAGAQANALVSLKLVTRDYAVNAFKWQMDGSFHRRFASPSSGQDTSLLGALTNYRITSVKECGTKVSEVSSLELSGGLKASLSAGIIELNAGGAGEFSTQVTKTLNEDDYLLMSTYFIEAIPSAPEVSDQDKNDLWFFRVIFRSKCENGTPKEATSIIIHYHRLPGQVLEVRTGDDLKRSYLEKWENYAYVPDNSASALRQGQFWTIKDLAGYFIWRDTLRNFIEVDNNVTSSLLARYPKERRPFVRDFFVFLMLTAAFHHRDPSI